MVVPNRNASNESYRYGYQGQEKDDDIKGEGNSLNYEFRMHDPRIGRFFAIDPLAYSFPWNSPYAFSENKVIQFIELEGLETEGLKIDYGFKVAFVVENKIKIKASVYTSMTNNSHGIAVNLSNSQGSMVLNMAYVPKVLYNVTANESKVELSGDLAGNPIRFSINNPTSGLFITEKPIDGSVSDVGIGVGLNLYTKSLSIGLVSQKLETNLNLPPTTFNGSTPIASFSPQLIQSSAADLRPKSFFKLDLGGSFEAQLDNGLGDMKTIKTKYYPTETAEEKEKRLRAVEKAESDKLESQNSTQLEKELNLKIKKSTSTKTKIPAKTVKKAFDLAKKTLN